MHTHIISQNKSTTSSPIHLNHLSLNHCPSFPPSKAPMQVEQSSPHHRSGPCRRNSTRAWLQMAKHEQICFRWLQCSLYTHNIHRMSRRHSLTSFSRSFEASMSSLFLDCVRTIQLTDMQPTTHSSQTTHGQAWTANHTQLKNMQPTKPIIHNMRGIAFHCHWPYCPIHVKPKIHTEFAACFEHEFHHSAWTTGVA